MKLYKKLPLIAMLGLFVVPFILAVWFYDHKEAVTVTTHGNLLNPASAFDFDKFRFSNLKKISEEDLNTKWRLILFLTEEDSKTFEKVEAIKRLQVALGRDGHRVETVFVSKNQSLDVRTKTVLNTPEAGMAHWKLIKEGHVIKGFEKPLNGLIAFMSPKHRVVLTYSVDTPHKLILKDMKRLLKVSKMS